VSENGTRTAVIGIGASAGGIEAFRVFFEHMPADSGFAFVVILHLPPDRRSLLPEIIGRWTTMPVVEASENCLVEPNHVYLPPSGVVVTLRNGHLHPRRATLDEPRQSTPIDMFFDSLGSELGEDAVGIILSGTGSDGALGLKAIKSRGGLTFAQGHDGSAPQHEGMPSSAIATGAVDIVTSVEAMPGKIIAVQNARRERLDTAEFRSDQVDTTRLAICAVLNKQLGHDFSGYKDKTFLRRVQRRMQVLSIGKLDNYLSRLESDRAEVVALFQDLLIGVTSFFRDAETFDALKSLVIPKLFAGKDATSTVRVWVAGCATGEEAYSLAILLRERADDMDGISPRIQVFATDIDESAIATARAGRYVPTLLDGLSPERRARFFVEGADGSFTVAKAVRDICTFSAHSLTRDPPFSRMDMISCRNLLIYLDTDLQADVIPAFHYSLVSNGVLMLGSSESISRHESLFSVLDRTHRIFQRRDTPSPALPLMGRAGTRELSHVKGGIAMIAGVPKTGFARLGSRASIRVLERYAPAFVVVNTDGEIIQFSSRIGRFLEPAAGAPSQNVLTMARAGLRVHLRAALRQATETGRALELPRVSVSMVGEGNRQIALVVEPLSEQGAETLYLIVFVESPGLDGEARGLEDGEGYAESGADRQLEAELRDTREQLQAVTEEHETALEELRSANEELHSVNEELQSTNEELETSKEEIQSINEELQTVNGQLAGKVDELDHRNSDLKNLFDSTQVATIFLDPYLVVRGFTPAVAGIYNLIPSDIGRPLTDIVSRLRYGSLRDDARHVVTTLETLERRVTREDQSAHYLMRIIPYRTPDSAVDGTLVTFVDVTSIVLAEQHQRLLVDELNHRVKNMLTVVISLANQTMRHHRNMEDFAESFLGRVHALNNAYSLLSAEVWQAIALNDLLTEELRPFMTENRRNIILQGPGVQLQPRAALALGMAIHELTTNAVKHGALSVPDGNILIKWQVERNADDETLVLNWTETGGPMVGQKGQGGFGMTLIERGLRQDMGAEVEVSFLPAGVRATIRASIVKQASISTSAPA
jgi:two-component system CheB/CheR fusion protein